MRRDCDHQQPSFSFDATSHEFTTGVCVDFPRVLQVTFYALDDQRFLDGWLAAQRGDSGKFDTIVFNYAVSIAFAISVLEAMP